MKTIGLIGGMSWESSLEYYRIINEEIRNRLRHLYSGKIMAQAAVSLERAGADVILIATNTMHKLANYVTSATSVPLLHIADATAKQIKKTGISKIGLLGTKFTMEQDFYKQRLINNFALDVLIPNEGDRDLIHHVIYDELCLGIVSLESKQKYLQIIKELQKSGAEGIILGCTEIELLISQDDCEIPIFPTAKIHALAAVDFALQ